MLILQHIASTNKLLAPLLTFPQASVIVPSEEALPEDLARNTLEEQWQEARRYLSCTYSAWDFRLQDSFLNTPSKSDS